MAASQEVLLELHQYFPTLPELEVAEVANGAEEASSYQSFARYAQRGLFSFEKTRLHERADTRYHLMAWPPRPLLVAELPGSIAELLSKTKLPVSVAEQTSLDASIIL